MSYDMLTDIANGRSAMRFRMYRRPMLDQPGRVKISAKNLDLTDVRIRAEEPIG